MTASFRRCPPDLVSQTVFSSLVRTPSADGPPEPRLNWLPADPPATPARPGSAQQQPDPVRIYIEHDVDEGTYDWQDVRPPLSARRGRKGPCTSQEGWIIRPRLPATPQTLRRPEWLPGGDPNLDSAPKAGRWSEASGRPGVLHPYLSVCPSDAQLFWPLPPSDTRGRAHWPW